MASLLYSGLTPRFFHKYRGFRIRSNTAVASISEFSRNIFNITQYAHIICHFEGQSLLFHSNIARIAENITKNKEKRKSAVPLSFWVQLNFLQPQADWSINSVWPVVWSFLFQKLPAFIRSSKLLRDDALAISYRIVFMVTIWNSFWGLQMAKTSKNCGVRPQRTDHHADKTIGHFVSKHANAIRYLEWAPFSSYTFWGLRFCIGPCNVFLNYQFIIEVSLEVMHIYK
jgi:hypothetical protein